MPKLLSVVAIAGFMAAAATYAYAAPEARLLEIIEEQRPQPRATGPLSLLVESRPPSLPSLVVTNSFQQINRSTEEGRPGAAPFYFQ